MSGKKAAIAVFVESGHPVAISRRFNGWGKFVLEFNQFLHNSLVYSGSCEDFDILAFGDSLTLSQLHDKHVVKIEYVPDPYWDRMHYGFGKSIAFIGDPRFQDLFAKYNFILRSDTDCFVTPNIRRLIQEPPLLGEMYCGTGGHSNGPDVPRKCREVAARMGLNSGRYKDRLGSTMFGNTADIVRAAATTEAVLRELLDVDFKDTGGEWPWWYRGVASMYAGEIAVNYHCEKVDQEKFLFDCHSTQQETFGGNQSHCHCWHSDMKFSKFWFYDDRYHETTFAENPTNPAEYCMKLAYTDSPLKG